MLRLQPPQYNPTKNIRIQPVDRLHADVFID